MNSDVIDVTDFQGNGHNVRLRPGLPERWGLKFPFLGWYGFFHLGIMIRYHYAL